MLRTLARTLAVIGVLAFGFSLVGCNTLEGAGKDIQSAGESIEDAAN